MDPLDLIQKGRIKRHFRATRKLTTPKLVSHITQRAAGKEPLFVEDNDYLSMLHLLKKISQNYNLRIFSFCLMPNHVHLLASPAENNLSDAMRDLFGPYVAKFNKKYERKGHLFGGPYRQAVCLDDSYLLTASVYIHLNPVNAGIVADPLKFRWSSCRLFCDPAAPESFVEPEFILQLLARSGIHAREIYADMLRKGIGVEHRNVMEQEDSIEKFRNKLAALFPDFFKKVGKKKKIAGICGIDLSSWEELEKQIENFGASGLSRKPSEQKAKQFLIAQLIARGYKRAEIAEKLNISIKTVYNILKSGE